MDSPISESRYSEALNWLFSQLPMFSRVGAPAYKPGLDTTLALSDIFGHPHKNFRSIHIAGTNGKGSTSHLIASALQSAGYKTGLYTSPHLTDFRERMRINGRMIPKEKVVEFVDRWKEIPTDLKPSFFELTMMMAFDWFASEKVDIAVIEVGMGGRLDSTNIITPELSVITNISFDHTQFLGNTLEAIAGEKAGIIKKDVPVVVGEASGVREVFESKAEETESPLIFAEENSDFSLANTASGWNATLPSGVEINVPLAGRYQKKNIRTALTAISILREKGFELTDDAVKEGFENVTTQTGLRGRWQIVQTDPLVICDTGHNVAGITETMESLQSLYKDRTIRFVVGFVNDKDVEHIVNLFPTSGKYYFTKASIPRAMDESEVEEHFSRNGIKGLTFPSVNTAFQAALADSSPSDIIYIGGSTFIVADFLAAIQ